MSAKQRREKAMTLRKEKVEFMENLVKARNGRMGHDLQKIKAYRQLAGKTAKNDTRDYVAEFKEEYPEEGFPMKPERFDSLGPLLEKIFRGVTSLEEVEKQEQSSSVCELLTDE